MVAYDPARITNIEATLVAMLGAGVTVEHPTEAKEIAMER